MKPSTCLNCGANLDISTNDKFIRCQYCQTVVGNYTPFEKIDLALSSSTDKDTQVIKLLASSLQLKDYQDLQLNADICLAQNPSSWLALTYKAIATFWLGYDNFEHLNNVLKLLEKARVISDQNEFVLHAIEAIGNDIIVVAAKNEVYGDELTNAVYAMSIAKQLTHLSDNSSALMNKYCQSAFQHYRNNLENQIKRDKSSYDPPLTSLLHLFRLSQLTGDLKKSEFFYLHAKLHLEKNKTKSYYSDLASKVKQIESTLQANNSSIVGKKLSFGFFGKPSIS